MRGGNHDTAGKILGASNKTHGRCGCHMHKIGIRPCCSDSCRKSILKHIAGSPCILTDNDTTFLFPALGKIVSQKLSHSKGVICRQVHIRFPSIAVCTEIFSHLYLLFPPNGRILKFRLYLYLIRYFYINPN